MLYNFNGVLLNVVDIVSVQPTRGQNHEYPFVLTVALRSGQQFAVSYRDEAARKREVNSIAQAYMKAVPAPVSRYEVEQIVSTYTAKIRNDLRTIKKLLKEGVEHG